MYNVKCKMKSVEKEFKKCKTYVLNVKYKMSVESEKCQCAM